MSSKHGVQSIVGAMVLFFVASFVQAASITPSSYTASIASGQSVTVQRTVTLDSGGPAANLVDVFFLADNTGSMGGSITTVRNNAQAILDAIIGGDSRFAGIDVAFGVGSYRGDPREYGSSSTAATSAYTLNQTITSSIADTRNGINQWSAGGGGDYPEANFFALHQIATSGGATDGIGSSDRTFETGYSTGWRSNAARVIVWFGDAASHTSTVDQDEVIAALTKNNIIVAAINTRGANSGIDHYGQAQAIVSATGGSLTNNVTGTDATVNAILNAVEAATATVDLSLDVRGDISNLGFEFECISPEGCDAVPAGESRIFNMTITGDNLGTFDYEVFAPQVTGAVGQDSITVRSCVSDLYVRTKSEKAQLVWTDTGADHYVVYRSLVSGGSYEQVAETRSRYSTYLDYGLTDGTTYYYVVREADASGNEYCQTVEASGVPSGRPDIRPANEPPEITSSPITSALEDTLYSYDVDASDPNAADVLTYQLDVSPSGMTINSSTGLIEWTPANHHVGTHQVVVRVADPSGLLDTQLFDITVTNVNDAPEIVSSPVITVRANDPYSYSVNAIDPDVGDSLTFTLLQGPAGMTIDSDLGLLTWIPDVSQVGVQDVEVQVADSAGLTANQSFVVTVTAVNRAPSIISTAITSATPGEGYVYDVEATDPNSGDTLSFSLLQAPAGMTLDANTGLLEWLPEDSDIGTYTVEVQVEDNGGLTDSQSFTLDVSLSDLAPEITSTPVTSASEGVVYNYDVEATDRNPGDVLTFSLDVAPSGMVIDEDSGLISWTPSESQVGGVGVTVRVTDTTGLSVTQSFALDVVNVPDQPEITSTPLTTATVEVTYSYDVEASDPDTGDILTYSLDTFPTGMSIDPSFGTIEWTPTLSQNGSHEVVVRVTDGSGLFVTQAYSISVELSPNEAPVITSSPISSANVGETYIYNVAASDPEGDSLTYHLDSGPSGMVIDAATGLIQLAVLESQVGTHSVTVRVTDNGGLFATQTYSLQVYAPPTASFSFSGVLTRLETVDFSGAASTDPDGGLLTSYLWDFGDGVTGSGVNVPHIYSATGTFTVTLTVTDDEGASSTASATLVIAEAMVSTPAVVGMEQAAAESAIVAAGLNVGSVTEENSTTVSAGEVLRQSPTAGTSVAEGSSVNIIVSLGPPMVSVPGVVGMTQTAAESAITSAGLIVGSVTTSQDATVPEGQVLEQNPAGGASVAQNSQVDIVVAVHGDVTAPLVTIQFSDNPVQPGQYTEITVVATDDVAVTALRLTIDGTAVALDADNKAQYQNLTEGTYAVSAEAEDASGNVGTASADLVVSTAGDDTAPTVSLSYSPASPVVGDTVHFTLTASDDSGVDSSRTWLKVDGATVPLTGGQGDYVATHQGTVVAVASVYDINGNCGQDQQTVTVTISGTDSLAPTASITAPATDEEILSLVDVTGTATDTNFAYYTLSYSTDGEDYVEYYRSETAVADGVLGVFDGTLLENGQYALRLSVIDQYGNTTIDEVSVQVSGEQKLGQFTLAYEDMTISLSGIDLTVVRTYDSRVKETRAFGAGWSLGISQAIRLSENVAPGTGYEVYCKKSLWGVCLEWGLQSNRDHVVTIQIPGARKQEFDVTAVTSYASQGGIAQGYLKFSPRTGTYSTLEPLQNVTFDFLLGGELLDFDFNLIDPNLYRLTLLDGTQYYYNQVSGSIYRVVDSNDNTVDIGTNAITHSSGAQINFVRDGKNRITSIEDADGRVVSYSYDTLGNLKNATDPNGNTVEYRYAADHYLNEIIDPHGIPAIRVEYDDDGRMISQARADGEAISYDYDTDNNQQTITDSSGSVVAFEYDEDGNITSKTDTLGNTWNYTYDDRGNQLTVVNPDGTSTRAEYDSKDNKLSETDELGNQTLYSYNSRGNLTSHTDPEGNVSTFEYDSRGNLLREIDADGVTQSTKTYDTSGNLLTETDSLGYTRSFSYDAEGHILTQADSLGRTTSFTYDGRGNVLTEIGPGGNVTSRTYDENNNLLTETDALGNTVTNTYTSFNKIKSKTDKRGATTQYNYDIFGQLVETVYPDGSLESKSYDVNGNVVSVIDGNGYETRSTFDSEGRLQRVTYPDGSYTENVYEAVGSLTSSTDANGNTTTYEYDDGRRQTAAIDALGHRTSYSYDHNGNQVSFVDATGNITQYQYDSLGRRVATIFNDGTETSVGYDTAGRKASATDQNDITTRYSYDVAGQFTDVTDALGNLTSFTYNDLGQKLTQTDAAGRTTSWTYDSLGNVLTHTLPGGEVESFIYDTQGNLLTRTDYNGDIVEMSYDSMNRLSAKIYPDGTRIDYTYTATGEIATVSDIRGVTQNSYDSRGRLVRVDNPDGSYLAYSYDAVGNRTSVTIPSGTSNYTYDALNRLTTVTSSAGEISSYEYDEVGNRTSVTLANGTVTSYAYDSLNRLTELVNRSSGGSVLSSYTYTLGLAGNRLSVVEENGREVDYSYDDLYRLTEELITDPVNGNSSVQYSYDRVGNRISTTANGIDTVNYSYDVNDRLLSTGSGTSYSYDDNGNRIEKIDGTGTTSFYYDYDNRLVTVVAPGTTTDFIYDSDGYRISSVVGAEVLTFLVDKNRLYGQVLEERDTGGNLTAVYDYGDDLLSQERYSGTSYYLYDGQSSVRQLQDSSEKVTDTYAYDAYGNLLATTGSTENTYLYTGEQYDPDINLYYLRARYYDQSAGLFLGMDPYSGHMYEPMTLHRYLYAGANPVMNVDPSGEFFGGLSSFATSLAIRSITLSIRFPVTTGIIKTVFSVVVPFEAQLWLGPSPGMVSAGVQNIYHSNIAKAALSKGRRLANGTALGKLLGEYGVFRGAVKEAAIAADGSLLPYLKYAPKGGKKIDFIINMTLVEFKTSGRHIDLKQAAVFIKAAKKNNMGLQYWFLENPKGTEAYRKLIDEGRKAGVEIITHYIYK